MSKLGEGTTAEIWVPRATAAEQTAPDPAPAAAAAAADPLPGIASLDIFLVDDHADVRRTTTAMLEARGRRDGPPALIITGYADASGIADRPADVAVLAKPFTLESLSRALAIAVAPVPVCRTKAAVS